MKERLIEAARTVRMNGYAPYSVYLVGAAVLGSDGNVYSGCNVENVSFGLCLCAERSAIAQMVAAGCTRIEGLAVVTKDGGTPCGMCRQVMVEFADSPDVPVWCTDGAGKTSEYSVGDLLPSAFQTEIERG